MARTVALRSAHSPLFFHYSTEKCIINWEIDGLNNHAKKTTTTTTATAMNKVENHLILVLTIWLASVQTSNDDIAIRKLNAGNDRHYYNYRPISIVWTAKNDSDDIRTHIRKLQNQLVFVFFASFLLRRSPFFRCPLCQSCTQSWHEFDVKWSRHRNYHQCVR